MPFPSNYQKSANKREAKYTADAKNAKVQKRAMTLKRNNEAKKRASTVTLTQMMRDMKKCQQEDTGGAEPTKRTKRGDNGDAERVKRGSNGDAERPERRRPGDTEQTERSRVDSAELARDAEVCAQRQP